MELSNIPVIKVNRHPILLDHDTQMVLEAKPGESLYAFLHRNIEDINSLEVSIDGRVIDSMDWIRINVTSGQQIVVRSTVHRAALYIVAMVALIYFTGGAAAAVAGGSSFGGIVTAGAIAGMSTAASMAAIGAVQIVGAMLINKVLGPKVPKAQNIERGSVYNIAAARNVARQWEPAGILFGSVRVTPDFAAQPFNRYIGNDQYMQMLLTPGINVARFDTLYFGDTPLSNFQSVTVKKRGFSAMPDDELTSTTNVDTIAGGTLDPNVAIVRTTPLGVTGIQVDISYLLFDLTTKGKKKYNQETVVTQIRKVGETAWTTVGTHMLREQEQTEQRRSFYYDVVEGQYDVSVRRLGLDTDGSGATCQFSLVAIAAYQAEQNNFDGVGVIQIDMKGTGQLNGAPDEVRAVMYADPLELWDGTQWRTVTEPGANGTSNPGAQVLMYARGLYDKAGNLIAGMGLDDDMIDIDALKALMVHCINNNIQYNMWVQDDRNHGEFLDAMMYPALGRVTMAPGRLTPIWAREDQGSSGVVNMGTIKKGEFQVNYTLVSAADGVELSYIDRATWETKTLRIPAPGVDVMLNPATIAAEGIIDEAQAAMMGRYHLGQTLYQAKDITYSTNMQFLTYMEGDLLHMQHDITQWGYGGRLIGIVNNAGVITITVDDMVPGRDMQNAWVGLCVPGETGFRLFQVQPFVGQSDILTLIGPWPDDAEFPQNVGTKAIHDTTWIYDFKATPGMLVRVVGMTPDDELKGASVSVVPESPQFWNYVKNGQYIPPNNESLLNAKPIASGLTVGENVIEQGDTVFTELQALWNITNNSARNIVTCGLVGEEPQVVAETSGLVAKWRIYSDGEYVITVRPYADNGTPGVGVTTVYSTRSTSVPPVNVDTFSVADIGSGIRKYGWGFNPDTIQSPDFAGVEIRYVAGSVANPIWEDMVALGADGFHTSAFESALPVAGQWTFAVRARNTSGILSADAKVAVFNLASSISQIVESSVQELVQQQQAIDKEIADRLQGDLNAVTQAGLDATAKANAARDAAIAAADAAVGVERQERITAVANEAATRLAATTANANAIAQEVLDRGTAIDTVTSGYQSADSALSTRIDTVSAAAGDNAAAITAEQQARVAGDSAEANQRTILATQLRGAYTGSDLAGVTSGLIFQERTARTTQFESVVQQVSLLSAGVGESFDYSKMWYFTNGADGWTGNGTPTWATSWLRPANHATDPYVISPDTLAVVAGEYQQVRFRVRKTGAPVWEGFVYWQTGSETTWADTRRVAVPEPTYDANGIGVVTINLPWTGTGKRIRIDLSKAQTASAYFEFDWIAIGRPAPGASSAALANEESARAAADQAETTARQTLSAKLTGFADPTGKTLDQLTSGLIYDERTARANADSAIASRTSVLEAKVDDPNTGLAKAQARITAEEQARVAADNALASRTATVEARMPAGSGVLGTAADVTAAQSAAQAASDKAGSKGEVIYGSTAPSADKRLAQNLWIDTTGNANTPKRWNGTAWVAVTDKAATDAAAAAAATQSNLDRVIYAGDSVVIDGSFEARAVDEMVGLGKVTATAARTGTKSLQLTGKGSTQDAPMCDVATAGDRTWYAECYMRLGPTDPATVGNINIAYTVYNTTGGASYGIVAGVLVSSLTNNWVKVAGTYKTSSNASRIILRPSLASNVPSGNVLIDDFFARDITEAKNALDFAGTVDARVTTVENASVSRDEALATRVGVVEARMPAGNGQLATDARVTAVESAAATANSATAGRVTTVEANLGGVQKSVDGNMAINGDMEAFATGLKLFDGTIGTAEVVSSDKYAGSKSLRIVRGTNATTNLDVVFPRTSTGGALPRYPSGAGRTYYLEAMVKLDATASAPGNSTIRLLLRRRATTGSESWLVAFEAKLSTLNGWTRLSGYATTVENTAEVDLLVSVPSANAVPGAAIFVDNIVMRDVTDARNAQLSADANAAGLSSLTTTVTQQGNQITAEATRIDAISARMPVGTGKLATASALESTQAQVDSQGTAIGTLTGQVTAANQAANQAVTATEQLKATAGGSGNLLANSTLKPDTAGWGLAWNSNNYSGVIGERNLAGDLWTPAGGATIGNQLYGLIGTPGYVVLSSKKVQCEAGKRYMASAYTASQRCAGVGVGVRFQDASGANLYEAQEIVPSKDNGGSDLTSWERVHSGGVAPVGAVAVETTLWMQLGVGNNNPCAWFTLPMLEEVPTDKTAPSPWSAGGMEAAAAHTVSLDVNGYISGTQSMNDGKRSSFSVLASVFRVISNLVNAGMEWQDGYLRMWKGSAQLVMGHTFGSGDLVFWYGPNIGSAACAKGNATIWFDTSGGAYFGGSLSAGVLKNAARSTQVSPAAFVETGKFGTNGNAKAVSWGFDYQNTFITASNLGGSTQITATVILERSLDNGAWLEISRQNVTGTRTYVGFQPGDGYAYEFAIASSATFTDNTSGTPYFNYRTRLIAANGWPYIRPEGGAEAEGRQNTFVISVEQ